jgi:2-oxoglutarate ferredoxin oxidoreductase subunit alpha
MDEVVAHMREGIEIPDSSSLEICNRKKPKKGENYEPYKDVDGDGIPPMASFGEGMPYHVTGLIHDTTGFPSTNPNVTEKLIKRIMTKVENNIDDIVDFEKVQTEDAETVIITFGCTARSAAQAIKDLRKAGAKIGMLRLKTIWPFAHKAINELPSSVKHLIVAEMNTGQLMETVKASSEGRHEIHALNKFNGELIGPDELADKVREVMAGA